MGKEKKEKKKEKKERKHKKEKKSKKRDSGEWVEKNIEAQKEEEKVEREEWMLKPTKTQPREEIEPPKEEEIVEEKKGEDRYIKTGQVDFKPTYGSIGDGGKSWREKALANLKKKAEQEGKDFRELAESHSGFVSDTLLERVDEIEKKGEKKGWRRNVRENFEERRVMKEDKEEPTSEFVSWNANKLKATALKASMSGDKELEEKIKREIERRERNALYSVTNTEFEEAPLLDIEGKPIHLPNSGSKMDKELREMVQEEKLHKGVGSDYLSKDARKLANNSSYKHTDNLDEQYEKIGQEPKKRKRQAEVSEEAQQQRKAQQTMTAVQKIMESCPRCYEGSQKMAKHLVIAVASRCYLALPAKEPFVEGHCYIVPMSHQPSSLELDEDTLTEIRNFKKCLIRMFEEQGRRPIFLETCLSETQQFNKHHTFLEVLPLQEDDFYQIPFYFKKALYESEEAENKWQGGDRNDAG